MRWATSPTTAIRLRPRSRPRPWSSTSPPSARWNRSASPWPTAVCRVKWKNGARLDDVRPCHRARRLVPVRGPAAGDEAEARSAGLRRRRARRPTSEKNSLTAEVAGQPRLSRGRSLGRPRDSIRYHQEGWGGMSYEVAVDWDHAGGRYAHRASGASAPFIRRPRPGPPAGDAATELAPNSAARALKRTLVRDLDSHGPGGRAFWAKSTIRLPDPVLEKQWYLETYKFGAASRRGAPPITLQAVWTADNGSLPPWKGDFHNDLNTQLSYWPCYQRQSSRGGPGLPRLALGDQAAMRGIHEAVFRRRRAQRPRRRDARRRADGRLDPVLARADGLGLAGPALLAPLAVQRRPGLPRRAGLSLGQGRRRLPRQHRRAPARTGKGSSR